MAIWQEKLKRDAAIRAWEESLPQQYEQDQWLQDYNPELLGQLAQQGPSSLENISLDPRMRQAQMDVLNRLQGLGQTGYDQIDQAAIQQSMDQAARQEQGQRGAIMQNMQARGMGGSGAELAAQLANQQGAANRNSMANAEIAAEGRRRALQAMTQSAGLAGQMENSDFARQAQIAQAKDQIARFNTQNQNLQQQYNNQLANQARAANISGRQGVSSSNVQGRNQFGQQNFQNQGQVAQVKAQQATNNINQEIAKNAGKKNILTGMISGAAAGAPMGPAGIAGGAVLGGVTTQMGNDDQERMYR